MEYIKLKHSDLTVSRFCMGGCPMGGYGWGETREQDFIDTIRSALDSGVNYFDTADTYGLGQSERTLAKGLGTHRHEVVIQSKFGVRAGNGATVYDNSPDYIQWALEQTLRRLQTDYLDIYVIHYWDGVTPVEDIIGELTRLRAAGKIRYFGLSNIRADQLPAWRTADAIPVNAQYEFSLACRAHDTELRAAVEGMDLTPLTWGSLGQGILTGKYDADVHFDAGDRRSRETYVNFHGEKLRHNLQIVDTLRSIAEVHKRSVAACAIRFILDYWRDSVVIAGVKNPAQLRSNLEAMDWHLLDRELMLLDRVSRSAPDHEWQKALERN